MPIIEKPTSPPPFEKKKKGKIDDIDVRYEEVKYDRTYFKVDIAPNMYVFFNSKKILFIDSTGHSDEIPHPGLRSPHLFG